MISISELIKKNAPSAIISPESMKMMEKLSANTMSDNAIGFEKWWNTAKLKPKREKSTANIISPVTCSQEIKDKMKEWIKK